MKLNTSERSGKKKKKKVKVCLHSAEKDIR